MAGYFQYIVPGRAKCLAVWWTVSLAACAPAEPTTAFVKSGEGIARDLISLSGSGTRAVPTKLLADKVCLIPEGVYANVHIQLLLPGAAIAEVEDDSSEGIWFLVLYNGETNLAYVKAVPQNTIEWEPPEIPIRDLARCVSELDIVRADDRFALKNPSRCLIRSPEGHCVVRE